MRWMLALLVLAACAAPEPAKEVKPATAKVFAGPAVPLGPMALRNPGFEQEAGAGARCASGWNCTAHVNSKAFRFFAADVAGHRSFCVEPAEDAKKAEPWALVSQGIHNLGLRGTRVRFSVALTLTGVTGEGAGPWLQAQRPVLPRFVTQMRLMTQTPARQVYSVELDVPNDAITVEVGVQLAGKGRACFDDARLEVLQGPKNPV